MVKTSTTTQEFLDTSQYLESTILQYESVYGEDFVSPGGRALALELIATLALDSGARVLDVGCGLGGSAFVMAHEFGLRVDAIDLSRNMLALAQRKLDANGLSDLVDLQWGDCLELERKDCYDAVYSRDVFLHIGDKQRLFERLYRALRPGGLLLFTDYCCGPQPWSEAFRAYLEERSYCLHTPVEYAGLIAGAGFEQVDAQDQTARFSEILQAELVRIEAMQPGEAGTGKLRQSWRQKIERARAGEQRWGWFTAVKPDLPK